MTPVSCSRSFASDRRERRCVDIITIVVAGGGGYIDDEDDDYYYYLQLSLSF